jgi:quinol monooxygenase YgiN
MITFTVRMKFSAEDREDIAEILQQLTEASRQEPGCVSYIPHRVEGDPDTVLIYEQYRDTAAAEAHRQSPHFKKYAVGGLYQKMLERSREDLKALA